MYQSKPAPILPDPNQCSSTPTHGWCNKRGYGFTVFHDASNAPKSNPANRVQPLHKPAAYLNRESLIPRPTPAVAHATDCDRSVGKACATSAGCPTPSTSVLRAGAQVPCESAPI